MSEPMMTVMTLSGLAPQRIADDKENGERLGGCDVVVAHDGLERSLLARTVKQSSYLPAQTGRAAGVIGRSARLHHGAAEWL